MFDFEELTDINVTIKIDPTSMVKAAGIVLMAYVVGVLLSKGLKQL